MRELSIERLKNAQVREKILRELPIGSTVYRKGSRHKFVKVEDRGFHMIVYGRSVWNSPNEENWEYEYFLLSCDAIEVFDKLIGE